MKKIVLVCFLILSLAFSLAACIPADNGNGNNNGNVNGGNTTAQYTVRFNLNNYFAIDPPATQTVNQGSIATEPANVVRPGYALVGWFEDSEEVFGASRQGLHFIVTDDYYQNYQTAQTFGTTYSSNLTTYHLDELIVYPNR